MDYSDPRLKSRGHSKRLQSE